MLSLPTPHSVSLAYTFVAPPSIILSMLTAFLVTKPTGPTVGIAVSGGGFRAALVGAGTFNALDGRNTTAVQAGTGGVWQLASYMTGLSGGSWFVGSLAINSNPSIYDLVLGSAQYQG